MIATGYSPNQLAPGQAGPTNGTAPAATTTATNQTAQAKQNAAPTDSAQVDAKLPTSALHRDPGTAPPSPYGKQPLSQAQGQVAANIAGTPMAKGNENKQTSEKNDTSKAEGDETKTDSKGEGSKTEAKQGGSPAGQTQGKTENKAGGDAKNGESDKTGGTPAKAQAKSNEASNAQSAHKTEGAAKREAKTEVAGKQQGEAKTSETDKKESDSKAAGAGEKEGESHTGEAGKTQGEGKAGESKTGEAGKPGGEAKTEGKGEKKDDKEDESTLGKVHEGIDKTSTVLTAPEKLKDAGETIAKIGEKGAAGELGIASKAVAKVAPTLSKYATKAGETGEKILEKTPVVGKAISKISEYASKASGVMAGDADAIKDTVKDLGDKFVKGAQEGGTVKHGVAAVKKITTGWVDKGSKAGEGAAKTGETAAKTGETAAKVGEDAAKTGTEAAGKAGEKALVEGAEHVAAHEGEKVAGKVLGKLIPGVNIAVSVACAGMDGKTAYDEYKKGNKTGAIIDGLHAVTDAAGVVPGVGTAISIGGDVLAAGAHWLFGK